MEENGHRTVMTSGEALARILQLCESIDSKLDAIIGFVNEAGEQINQLAGEGLGSIIASMMRASSPADGD